MSTRTTDDGREREPRPASPDLRRLPRILGVEAIRVRYRQPRPRVMGRQTVEATEAVELLVRTEEPFAVRALAPALWVGDVEITASEQVGPYEYRFTAYDVERLRAGATISVGWAGQRGRRVRTPLRYAITREEAR